MQLDDESARTRFDLGKDVRDWTVTFAKNDLKNNYPNKESITKISYRPFDDKWTFYTGKSKGFHCMPRGNVMQHFINGENLGLIFKRGFTENAPPIFISNSIIEFRSWSRPGMQGGDYVVPLYLFIPQADKDNTIVRSINLSPLIVEKIANNINLEYEREKSDDKGKFAPIDILDYIYAVLHSPVYRERYKEFLKIDFPRVPYPENAEKFWALVELGRKLRKLHLLENVEPKEGMATYKQGGTHKVEKLKYEEEKVYINDTQFFGNVPSIAWNFYIGGYQPAQKWLKDRKSRKLDSDDVRHYRKIIRVLVETEEIMKEIDEIYYFTNYAMPR
jgi:predicted helicase